MKKKVKKDEWNTEWTDLKNPPEGFIFLAEDGEIGNSIPISRKELKAIPKAFGNEDKLFVRCRGCSVFMNYIPRTKGGRLNGRWECPWCKMVIREILPYDKLDEENKAFEKEFLEEYDDDF